MTFRSIILSIHFRENCQPFLMKMFVISSFFLRIIVVLIMWPSRNLQSSLYHDCHSAINCIDRWSSWMCMKKWKKRWKSEKFSVKMFPISFLFELHQSDAAQLSRFSMKTRKTQLEMGESGLVVLCWQFTSVSFLSVSLCPLDFPSSFPSFPISPLYAVIFRFIFAVSALLACSFLVRP